jgi:hypothetical protein
MSETDFEDDTLTKTGAERLAARLDAFWHAQGAKTVRHWVVAASGSRNVKPHRPVFVVRSNLVRGQPPPWV